MRIAASLATVVPAALIASIAYPLEQQEAPALVLSGVEVQRVEVQANLHTSSTQETAALDRDAAGRTVVVWQSKRRRLTAATGSTRAASTRQVRRSGTRCT